MLVPWVAPKFVPVMVTDVPTAAEVGDKLVTASPASPVPVRFTTCGLVEALSVRTIVPVRVPAAVGVNVTLIVQFDPAASVAAQVVVSAKSPFGMMLVIFSAAFPALLNVRLCSALVVPTVVPPPAALNVAMTDVRASVAEEVAVAVCVPVAEMILSSERASVPDPVLGDNRVSPYPVPAVQVPAPLSLPT